MKIKKQISIGLGLIFLALALLFFLYLKPRLPILTGYAAKMTCSCTFVANRSFESILDKDLNFFPVKLAKAKIDHNAQSASASFFGLSRKTAHYIEGRGCFLTEESPSRANLKFKLAPYNDSLSFAFHQQINDTTPQIDRNILNKALISAFDEEKEWNKKTRAVVVIHNGKLVGEKYADGIDHTIPLLGWSMTKSITNALIGILVHKGKLTIDERAPIGEWVNDERNQITVDHLLQMESGLEWIEDYFSMSDVTRMLYMTESVADLAISKPLEFTPENEWEYSSGTSNILARILRNRCTDFNEYMNFPYVELFYKIGMQSARMETDARGNFIGSSYCFATARDWAKFGLLYLNDGVWNGERILPDGWVEYTSTPVAESNGIYGAQFWLNAGFSSYPDAPEDLFSANGFQGQRVFIIPSKNLVIVRLGLGGEKDFDFNVFLNDICSAFPTIK